MKILAFDTSTSVGSIALSVGKNIIAESSIYSPKTHSETLLPTIDKILKKAKILIHEIDAIAISIGPGSFTGLRIGLSTAKGICFGLKIPLIPICTLMSLANNVQKIPKNRKICPVLDAGRGNFYSAIYSSNLDEILKPNLFTKEELLNQINSDTIFVGQNIEGLQNEFYLNEPTAASLVDIIHKKDLKPVYDYNQIANLQPMYIRKSSAEERFHKI